MFPKNNSYTIPVHRTIRNQLCGGRGLGDAATVWDAEITAIAEMLKRSKGNRLLILSDSKAAIAAIVKAGTKGQGRTRTLREATDLIARRCRNDKTAVCLGWVKSHIRVEGNKAADENAKKAAEGQRDDHGRNKDTTLVTEGGVRQKVSAQRREERQQAGWGLGMVARWGRRATTWYTYLRTDRGLVGKWKKRTGMTEYDSCDVCVVQETG